MSVDLGIEHPGDLRVRARLVLHDLRRAQRLAAMHEGDLVGEARQEHRLLHRRIAAADDRDVVTAKEVAVARRARRDAVAHQLPLGRKTEQLRRRAGRDDERARRVFGLGRADHDRPCGEIDRRDVALNDLGAEPLGLGAHLGHQIGAENPVAVAGKILDHRGQHELTAGFDALDEEWFEVGAGGVERRGQAGRARSDDDDVARV